MVIMRSDGEPERRVRITNAGGDGSFSVTLTQGSTKLLDVGSEEPAVIGSDDVLLFSIPTERGIVGLVPLDSGAGLDVTIELLGQGARDNGVIVDAGDVQVPEWIIDPPPDVSLIAVRSKATSGVLSVRHVAIEDRLSAGDELIGEELSAGSPTAYYVIDELGSEASGIILNSDQDVTPFAQVFSSGSPKPVVIYPYFVSSLGSVAVLAESTQPSILSVQRSSPEGDGFFPGEPDPPFDGRFDLSVVRVETLDPRDEDPVQGDGLGLYDVDIPTPSGDVTSDKPELQVIATPTSGGSIDLSLFDAAGYPESSSSSSNAIRFPFPGWIPAELFIGVRSDAFEVEVRGPDVIPIRESPYRQSVMEGGLFTVDLPQDTYRTVAVRPGNATSDWAVAVYRDPLLQPILRQDFATDYLTTLGCEGAGLHTIALRRYAIDFDSSAAAADLVVAPATADDCPATAATPFSNSEIGADIYGLLVNEGAPDEAAICITSALLESPGEDALAELGVLELQPEAIELAGQAALDCDVPESFIDQFVTALIG